ncbi:MAG TPA: lipocalin-like domain-containing protein [Candidatus Saccharimonadales bacterium]|nr:lipocalin-like domain-containing protein [Candidatus Saccharimonadales bacterium]
MKQNIPDEQYIADALWQKNFDLSKVPQEIKTKITSQKHSAAAYGERMRDYINWLYDHPQSYNPNYNQRYKQLSRAVQSLTPHQAYILRSNTLGKNASQGFEKIPDKANIKLPHDNKLMLRSQVGWHFFVGSVWGEDGQEYGVELMFFGTAILPPQLAADAGLSDLENQIMEVQLAISKAGEVHHQADPVVVAGTSGLLECSTDPFSISLGKNHLRSSKKGALFPLNLTAKGWDRAKAGDSFEIGLDLNVNSDRPVLYQGDDGAMPSLAGIGTLYYSIPALEISPGSSLTYGGKQVKLKRGLLWYDHQWGFMGGNPNSAVLRAASNMGGAPASGWDWYMMQFDGNRQITVFATHSNKLKQFYFQSGPTPPGTMQVSVAGKYMDEAGDLHIVWGELTIDGWAQAKTSPNPALYPVTNVWHPNHWIFEFNDPVPEDIRHFSMEQIVPVAQTNYFANTAQYNEGAVYIKNVQGEDIGRGFAEAVSYANTSENAYRLLGFEQNARLTRTLQNQTASLLGRLASLCFVIGHQSELKHELTHAAGLEFMGPGPAPVRRT